MSGIQCVEGSYRPLGQQKVLPISQKGIPENETSVTAGGKGDAHLPHSAAELCRRAAPASMKHTAQVVR